MNYVRGFMVFQKSLAFILARGVPGALSLLAIVVYTHLMAPEIYGQYAVLVSLAGLFISVFYQWMQFSLLRYYHKTTISTVQLLSQFAWAFTALSLLLLPLFNFVLILSYDFVNGMVIAVISLLIVSHAFFDLSCQISISRGQAGFYGLLLGLKSLLALGLAVTLLYLGAGMVAPLAGLGLSYFLLSVYLAQRYWHAPRDWVFDKDLSAQLMRYGLPLAATFIMNYLMSNADRLMLSAMHGAASAGLYAAPFDLSNLTFIVLLHALHLALYPLIIKAYEQQQTRQLHQLLNQNIQLLVLVSILPLIIFMIYPQQLAAVLLGEAFQAPAISIIPLIAMATLFMGIKAYITDLPFLLKQKTSRIMVINALGVAVNIVANFYWIPRYGIEGAAYATLAGYLVSTLLSLIWGLRYNTFPLQIITVVKVVLLALLMLLIAKLLAATINDYFVGQIMLLTLLLAGLVYAMDMLQSRRMVKQWWLMWQGKTK